MADEKPTITRYEGHEAASEASIAFEREHKSKGHRVTWTPESETLAIVRCLDCGDEFREIYTPSDPPVTSN